MTTNEAAAAAPAADDPAQAAAAAQPAAPAAPATPAAPAAAESLLTGVDPAAPAAAPPAGENDWLPEKYRVMVDGKLDEGASARKLADAYRHLEGKLGSGDVPPKAPEDYALQVEGMDPEALKEFKADPMFQDFAKAMHEAGLTDKQMNAVVARYLKAAPELLAADQQLSADEAKAELSKVWTDDATLQKNLSGVVRAINAFGAEAEGVPGSRARLMEKYGTDPDFIAFAATIAGELREDQLPSTVSVPSDVDVESLQKSEAYWSANHPDHAKVKAQVEAYYARKYGTKRR